MEFFLISAPQINSSSTYWWVVGWQLIQAVNCGVRQNWVILSFCFCYSCMASVFLSVKREYELLCKLWGLEWDHAWEYLAQSLNPVRAPKMIVAARPEGVRERQGDLYYLYETLQNLFSSQFCEMGQETHIDFASMHLAPCQMLDSYCLVDFIHSINILVSI